MFPSRNLPSRYLRAARRARLARLVAVGAVVVIPAACGGTDTDAFGTAATDPTELNTTEVEDEASTTDATELDTVATIEPGTSTGGTTAPSGTSSASTGSETSAPTGTFPVGAEVVVEFTYSASSGRVHNPYVAVWVEDLDGNLVTTIGVWYEQSRKGTRWLSDLLQWSSVSGGSADASVTGATRTPGSYALAWDGTDDDGAVVTEGDYVLFVESARERGPYQITSSTITVSGDGFTVSLPDDGELTDITATMTV